MGKLAAAHKGGLRAGMVEPKFYRPGGTRGILRISEPLNPYNNIFATRWRPLLAMAWENGLHKASMQRFNKPIKHN